MSSDALQSHIDNSSYHHLCDDCDLDFYTAEDLDDHDVDVHNMCTECDTYFDSLNILQQVGSQYTQCNMKVG